MPLVSEAEHAQGDCRQHHNAYEHQRPARSLRSSEQSPDNQRDAGHHPSDGQTRPVAWISSTHGSIVRDRRRGKNAPCQYNLPLSHGMRGGAAGGVFARVRLLAVQAVEGNAMTQPEEFIITAIEPQARRRDRVSIFVNGEFALGVHAEVAIGAGLSVGQTVDVPALRELAAGEELRRAREAALRLLGYRARSRAEIERALKRKGYEEPVIATVVANLGRSELIDDAEFSRSWVRARTSRPMGSQRIAAELRQKGVEPEVVDEALEAISPEAELEGALSIGRAKTERLRGDDPVTARRKLLGVLRRRGFSWDVCSRALNILLPEGDRDEA
jgi:regulatory protein